MNIIITKQQNKTKTDTLLSIRFLMAPPVGLEPTTTRLTAECSGECKETAWKNITQLLLTTAKDIIKNRKNINHEFTPRALYV